MSRAPHTPQELAEQFVRSSELVNEELDLSSRERAVLNVILRWSLKRGREWAEFDSLDHLGGLAHMDRRHAAACIQRMQGDGMLHCTRRRGEVRCRFLPTGALVAPPTMHDPRILADLVARAERLNALPEGFEPDGQRRLALETPEGNVENELARESRERAGIGTGGRAEPLVRLGREGTKSVPSKVPNRYLQKQNEGTESVPSQPRAPARARHDHDYEETTSLMNHDHEGDDRDAAEKEEKAVPAARAPARWRRDLRALEFELFERLEAAMEEHGERMTTRYEQQWCAQITADPRAAYDAIGDAVRALREGKVRKTVGGLANRLWNDFSGAKPYRKPSSITAENAGTPTPKTRRLD